MDSPSDAQSRAHFLPSPAESKRVQSNLAYLGIIGSEPKLERRPSDAEYLPLMKDQQRKRPSGRRRTIDLQIDLSVLRSGQCSKIPENQTHNRSDTSVPNL